MLVILGGLSNSFHSGDHYENKPIRIYAENVTTKKLKFSDKKSDIFHISAQNTDC